MNSRNTLPEERWAPDLFCSELKENQNLPGEEGRKAASRAPVPDRAVDCPQWLP